MKLAPRLTMACVALCLSGCVTAAREPPASRLAGTEWVLIGFHEGKEGTELQEVRPYAYTMRLEKSGAARFKFDCNQGSSTWRAAQLEDGKGMLSFGAIAATTALCGPGSIGETLSSDVRRMTRYSIYDGRLTMPADGTGRTYVWDSVD